MHLGYLVATIYAVGVTTSFSSIWDIVTYPYLRQQYVYESTRPAVQILGPFGEMKYVALFMITEHNIVITKQPY